MKINTFIIVIMLIIAILAYFLNSKVFLFIAIFLFGILLVRLFASDEPLEKLNEASEDQAANEIEELVKNYWFVTDSLFDSSKTLFVQVKAEEVEAPHNFACSVCHMLKEKGYSLNAVKVVKENASEINILEMEVIGFCKCQTE